MCVRHLGRLPWEVRRIPEPGERAPHHQFMLALAMMALDSEAEATALRKHADKSRTPAKWRRIHSRVDKAASVMARMGW